MLSVAVIGAGNIGKLRAQVIQRSRDSRVLVVADVDQTRAMTLATQIGVHGTSDWRTAVRDPQVDAVVVCTPTKFHGDATIQALQAGKHVLCEKPLARSVSEAEDIVKTAETHQRVLKTGFNYRYMDNVRKAKELIDGNALGPLYFLRCRYGHGGRPGYEKEWCTDLDISGGGVLLEQGIHILDLVRYLLGEPARVTASTSRFFWNLPDVEDNCFVEIQTTESQTAQIHVSWTQWINILSLEIFGRDGYLNLSGRDGHYGPQRLVWGRRQANHGRPAEEVFEFPLLNASWENEWLEFTDAIKSGRQPMGNPIDSLRALQLVEAAYESSHRQAWVEVTPLTVLAKGAR